MTPPVTGGVSRTGLTARRVAHRSPGRELLHRRDLELLAWLGEQYGARIDQLQRRLGCELRTAQRTVARMRGAGLVCARHILVGEPTWVLPTAAGLRTCSSPFTPWQPKLGLLAHVAAVNDVRIYVERSSPWCEWVCERALLRERSRGEHLPDAVVLLDGQRVAIEVELTAKSRRRTVAIVDQLARRFDAVVYFCAPATHRVLEELAASGRWRALAVRELALLGQGGT